MTRKKHPNVNRTFVITVVLLVSLLLIKQWQVSSRKPTVKTTESLPTITPWTTPNLTYILRPTPNFDPVLPRLKSGTELNSIADLKDIDQLEPGRTYFVKNPVPMSIKRYPDISGENNFYTLNIYSDLVKNNSDDRERIIGLWNQFVQIPNERDFHIQFNLIPLSSYDRLESNWYQNIMSFRRVFLQMVGGKLTIEVSEPLKTGQSKEY